MFQSSRPADAAGCGLVAEIQALHAIVLTSGVKLEAANTKAETMERENQSLLSQCKVSWEECRLLQEGLAHSSTSAAAEMEAVNGNMVLQQKIESVNNKHKATASQLLEVQARLAASEAEVARLVRAEERSRTIAAKQADWAHEQHARALALAETDKRELRAACDARVQGLQAQLTTALGEKRAVEEQLQKEVAAWQASLAAMQDGRSEQTLKTRLQRLGAELKAAKAEVAQVRGELAGVRAAQQQQPAGGGGGRSLSLGGQLNFASLLQKR
ncbi:hypothetical protein FOA52_014068 [Chlamydomonas sp. UWO 241]|nr:hypothetical protein FOA52_014068 [Chlamydomonas sp. UWO 241]